MQLVLVGGQGGALGDDPGGDNRVGDDRVGDLGENLRVDLVACGGADIVGDLADWVWIWRPILRLTGWGGTGWQPRQHTGHAIQGGGGRHSGTLL